jgi:hypothetical protein
MHTLYLKNVGVVIWHFLESEKEQVALMLDDEDCSTFSSRAVSGISVIFYE